MAKLGGPQKAAMVLLALGEEVSARMLKNLSVDEIRKLGIHMSSIRNVEKQLSNQALEEFIRKFNQEDAILTSGDQFLDSLLPNVLGHDQAKEMLQNIDQSREEEYFQNVRELDSKVLANFIKGEHPQTIAIILVHLGHEKASEVLGLLPEYLQPETISRVAHLETVPPDLIREVDEVLERELLSIGKDTTQKLGGSKKVAEILNRCDRQTSDNILQTMEERESDLADEVRKLMFVFDDLAKLDDPSVRELLKEINNQDLMLALKTGSDEVKEKIFSNLSQRAAQILREDISAMGPARLSDVEAAQQNILNTARMLEKEGRIILALGEGGDAVV